MSVGHNLLIPAVVVMIASGSSAQDAVPGAEPVSTLSTPNADLEGAFVQEFGRELAVYDRRVRSLRFAGWILVSAGVSWYPALLGGYRYFVDDRSSESLFPWVRGAAVPAAMLLVGGACLIRARVMTGRKRRFLRRHGTGVSELDVRELELSVAPMGAGLQLGLRW